VNVEPEIKFDVPPARAPVAVFGLGVARREYDDCHCLSPAAIPMDSDNATRQTNLAETPLITTDQLPPSENKLFRKWRREFSLMTGYDIDPTERVFTINRRNCERWKKDLLNYSTLFLPIRFSSLRSRVI
jgi:hypothetical protein